MRQLTFSEKKSSRVCGTKKEDEETHGHPVLNAI
jgi:hypothetical protein